MAKYKLRGILIAVFIPLAVWAGNLVLPFTFQSGAPIRASEMNDNFAAVKQSINDLDARVAVAGLAKSGTRLKTITMESGDGASSPLTIQLSYEFAGVFWDSQLETTCIGGSAGYCLPSGSGFSSHYSDAACQARIAALGPGGSLAGTLPGTSKNYLSERLLDGGIEVREIGLPSALAQPLYDLQGQSLSDGWIEWTCFGSGSGRTAPFVRVVPMSELATVSLHIR